MSRWSEPPLDTIAAPVEVETEVERSRFLAHLERVADLDAAAEVVRHRRREHPDASHHCSAMIAGPQAERQRSNDDGEPAGTAGAPMLAVLRGAELTDVVVVVTRWFGGTKLGAGGLVRAYGEATRAAIDAAQRLERRVVERLEVTVGHAEAGRLEHLLRTLAASNALQIDDPVYRPDGVELSLAIPAGSDLDEVLDVLAASGIDHGLNRRGPALREVPRRGR